MRRQSIFWIEDCPEDVLLLRTAFHVAGVDVELVVADSIEGARRYLGGQEPFRDSPRPPDLMLLDLNLPRANGEVVLEELVESGLVHGVPMVMFTTSASPRDVERCLKLGATECITKPAKWDGYEEVVARLRRHLQRSASHRGAAPSGG